MDTLQVRGLTLGARVPAGHDRLTLAFPSSCPVAPVVRHSVTLLAWVRVTLQAP
jgi:hypothetical protein